MNGTRNFILPGYVLQNNMIVYDKMFSQLEAWDKSKFMALRKRVKAKGGKIVAYLRRGLQDQFKDFDKEILKSSVREFVEAYPVDGFWMVNDWFDEDQLAVTKKRFEAFKELGIVTTVKSNYYEWHRALETGIPQLADLSVVTLGPRVKGEASDSERGLFLTDAIAEKAIKNATEAGVQAAKLILEISSVAKTYDKSDDPRASSITHYHDVITKFGADPDGDGTVFGPDGRLYYFYSRTRAIGKVRLARRFGLHGIAVDHLELQ
ncbi:hypothetical protein FOZ62_031735 [Perkinsus olseni]|uniref:Uncharacterized protein n=2 Tax=Perkinsus olseni TaxID=32597 RepID=A0A7J6PSR1_PEROL|nr:hypothetical protein FOZ62_031735 [Perkinsus olseni]